MTTLTIYAMVVGLFAAGVFAAIRDNRRTAAERKSLVRYSVRGLDLANRAVDRAISQETKRLRRLVDEAPDSRSRKPPSEG